MRPLESRVTSVPEAIFCVLPVIRPLLSRCVTVPVWGSSLEVETILPELSRVVTVPVGDTSEVRAMRPEPSRIVSLIRERVAVLIWMSRLPSSKEGLAVSAPVFDLGGAELTEGTDTRVKALARATTRGANEVFIPQMDLAKLSLVWDANSSQFIHFPVPDSSLTPAPAQPSEAPDPTPSFREALRFWVKLGFVSFGGPAGQIAIMHTELVDRKKWISEPVFLHALNFCMLLPGPEAQQLATYLGWRLHGVRGGIASGALFVLPAVIILWGLSWLYMSLGHVEWVAAIFYGLQPAVMAIVAAAVLRVGRKALRNSIMWGLAVAAFAALFVFKAPFAVVMLGAGLLGWLGSLLAPRYFGLEKDRAKASKGLAHASDISSSPRGGVPGEDDDDVSGPRSGWSQTLRVVGIGMVLWWGPILLAGWLAGWQSVWFKLGFFFSKAALITFGGAYAVLPYVAQQAVDQYHWLTTPQMMSGLALAETTPGPLIMVLQFVGFAGAWQNPGSLPPLLAATLGATITTWATFLPSFIFVLTGAPYIERLRRVRGLTAMLSAITAAVVGVILNLAVWFGIHTLWPGGGQLDGFALALAAVLFAGMHWRKWDVIPVVAAGGMLGLVWRLLLVGSA